ncbi:hypothetical protein PG994_005499 [Apiospora phragmitis]|uniref:Ankyrin repeat protein n=1 Tax=Apiospora phragmitis TaxID=2905665 RepID=A0ABR1VG58_9PEZI
MTSNILLDRDKDLALQKSSRLARLPPELHLIIAMRSDSDETLFALIRTCKWLFGVYGDALYKRNIRHDNGSAVFKISRNGEVAAFQHLERVAASMKEGLPALNRVQFRSLQGQIFIGSSLEDRSLCPFPAENSFTALHWAAAGGHSGAVQWLIAKGAEYGVLGRSLEERFMPMLMGRRGIRSAFIGCISKSCTPLFIAVCAGHLEASRRLLDAGSTLDAYPDQDSEVTILDVAIIYGHVDLIRHLVQNGHYNPARGYLYTAVASKERTKSLRCLAGLGHEIFEVLRFLIVTEYSDAISEVLAMLQDSGMGLDLNRADACDPSRNQATALLLTCITRCKIYKEKRKDFTRVVRFLISKGADVNYQVQARHPRRGGAIHLLESALLLENDNGALVQDLIEGGARVRRPSGEQSLIDIYVQALYLGSELRHDFRMTRAHGSQTLAGIPSRPCIAVYKVKLILDHGACLTRHKSYGLLQLELVYRLATSKSHARMGPRAAELSLLQVLVDSGTSREPDARIDSISSPSYLFRALVGRHYDVARIFLRRGGTCFGVSDRMTYVYERYDQMPDDLRNQIDGAYFL